MQVRVDVPMANPLDDLTAALAAEGVDTSVLGTPGRIDLAGSLLDQQLIVSDDGRVEWESGYLVRSMDAAYLEETDLHFTAHADGYESDEAIHKALKTDPYVLVIPSYLATGANNQASYGFGAMPGVTYDEIPSEGSFAPHQIRLRGSDGMARTFTIIGVIDANYTSAFGYYIGTPTMDALIAPDEPRFVSYFMTVDDAADPSVVAAEIERALLRYGVQGVDLIDELKQNQEQQSSFITVMQGFMGLGMIVGVAAVGVIAYRAVVERRQQIGMLRALGFQTRVVATAFVVETAVVVILGAGSGAILGLLVSRNLANDPATTGGVGGVAFEIPWVTLLVTVGVAVVAALVMSWFPARQASRILPAEALRYE
jgi:putative ABC transport system permease protein